MTTPSAPPRERPGGYRRSPGGLVGAMVATVLAVLAFVAFRGLTRDNPDVRLAPVDWQISMKAGRTDGQLQVLAPASLPEGWRATSARYTPGAEPAWHLGMLTEDKKYVGIEEARAELDTLVRRYVDEHAEAGSDVTVDGQAWQVFTDPGGDYALGRTIAEPGKPIEAQLVVGSAPDATIRAFAATLEAGSTTPQ